MNRIACTSLLLSSACFISKPIGDVDTDDGSGSATSGSTSDGPGMTSMGDVTGDPDGDPFRVDCAEQDWGMVVGGGELGPLGFPIAGCNPRSSGEAFGYKCCSTDPSTADGDLPAYENKNITGSTPLYADAANTAGTWGMCIRTADIPHGSALLASAAEDCPIPCNPLWSAGSIEAVCGTNRVCCQTHELRDKDCVQENGVWRPVTGEDIGNSSVEPNTIWAPQSHDTHQDPNGTVCTALAGDQTNAVFLECIRHLTVANQRGVCMSLAPGQLCPDAEPSYVDACEAKNG